VNKILLSATIAMLVGAAAFAKDPIINGKPDLLSPNATRAPTLDGMPLAGPVNSDCQVYVYAGGTAAINCPLAFVPVTGTHTVQPNEWGSILVASGGGMVTVTLPLTTSAGRNSVGFATDGKTSITVTTTSPAVMQGSELISPNGTSLAAGPNSNGWASLASPNLYQVSFR